MSTKKRSLARIRIFRVALLVLACVFLGGCQSIQTAARRGDLKEVKRQLAWGVSPNTKTLWYRVAPLHEAAGTELYKRNREIVELLLEQGADVNIRDKDGGTPLHWATRNSHTEAMEILLAHGADATQKGTGCGTPMQWAGRRGQIEAIRTLIEHRVSVDQKGSGDGTALMEAVRYGHLETVKYLLANGADVNARAENGSTAFHNAAWTKNVEIGRILLAHGADTTLEYNEGRKVPQSFLDQLRK